jgi:hypothetical protein
MMTENDKTTPTNASVTAVKKWIKLYSDNPIHEAIDRIIDCCEALELPDCDRLHNSIQLHQAAEALEVIAAIGRIQEISNHQRTIYEEKTN